MLLNFFFKHIKLHSVHTVKFVCVCECLCAVILCGKRNLDTASAAIAAAAFLVFVYTHTNKGTFARAFNTYSELLVVVVKLT